MIGYTVFMKHAEKITKKVSASRPVLKGVHHTDGGDLVVTDAHRLYLAKNAQSQQDGSIVCPTTGQQIEGSYPDVHRLIPVDGEKLTVEMDVVATIKAAKAMKSCGQLNEKTPLFQLDIDNDNTAYLTVKTDAIEANFRVGNAHVNEQHDLYFSSQYFIEAMDLFKDAGYTKVTLTTYGGMRPFTIKPGDELLALILPVRRY